MVEADETQCVPGHHRAVGHGRCWQQQRIAGAPWKWELQQFANGTRLAITVCHFPPGTNKWNKIEHRLFSHIAMNRRGKPLVDLVTIVNLIGETTTEEGLRVRSEIGRGRYPMGVAITDQQMSQLQLEPHGFHGDWNYTVRPRIRAP